MGEFEVAIRGANPYKMVPMHTARVWPVYRRQEAIKSYVGGKGAMSFIALVRDVIGR